MRRGAGRQAGRSATSTRRRLANLNAAALRPPRVATSTSSSSTGFTTPTTLYFAKGGTDAREKLKSLPAFFDATGLVVTQHEADLEGRHEDPVLPGDARRTRSSTGRTRPSSTATAASRSRRCRRYSGVRRQRLARARAASGCSPTCAAAASSGRPGTRSRAAKGARRRTTTTPRWPRTSSARKVTSPAKLGILGGSQGGLLVSATHAAAPGALRRGGGDGAAHGHEALPQAAGGRLVDGRVRRPDKPEDWAFISKYSPYQNVLRGRPYPKMLITTSTRDDRVHPGHARKMAARMQQLRLRHHLLRVHRGRPRLRHHAGADGLHLGLHLHVSSRRALM